MGADFVRLQNGVLIQGPPFLYAAIFGNKIMVPDHFKPPEFMPGVNYRNIVMCDCVAIAAMNNNLIYFHSYKYLQLSNASDIE